MTCLTDEISAVHGLRTKREIVSLLAGNREYFLLPQMAGSEKSSV